MIVAWLVPVAIVAGVVLLFNTTYVIYVLVVKIVIIVKGDISHRGRKGNFLLGEKEEPWKTAIRQKQRRGFYG